MNPTKLARIIKDSKEKVKRSQHSDHQLLQAARALLQDAGHESVDDTLAFVADWGVDMFYQDKIDQHMKRRGYKCFCYMVDVINNEGVWEYTTEHYPDDFQGLPFSFITSMPLDSWGYGDSCVRCRKASTKKKRLFQSDRKRKRKRRKL